MRALHSELGPYISLATFRRDATAALTPVWFAERDGKLYVFTEADSYKVRRLRRNPRVRVAACTMRGRVTGEWIEGRGRVVDEPQTIARAYEALRSKYGWQMRLVDLVSTIAGRIGNRAILELDLSEA
jgi:hypothetical protein